MHQEKENTLKQKPQTHDKQSGFSIFIPVTYPEICLYLHSDLAAVLSLLLGSPEKKIKSHSQQ